MEITYGILIYISIIILLSLQYPNFIYDDKNKKYKEYIFIIIAIMVTIIMSRLKN